MTCCTYKCGKEDKCLRATSYKEGADILKACPPIKEEGGCCLFWDKELPNDFTFPEIGMTNLLSVWLTVFPKGY